MRIKLLPWRVKTALLKKYIQFQDRFGLYSYSMWLKNSIHPGMAKSLFQNKTEPSFQPTFDLIVTCDSIPAGQVPSKLNATICSVAAQSYPGWRIFFAASCRSHAASQWLDDPRIQLIKGRDDNFTLAHVLPNGNPSNWVSWMKAGDELDAATLQVACQVINRQPDTDVIYFDEDLAILTKNKTVIKPFLKPDWSPELLVSVPYVQHALIKQSLLLENLRFSSPIDLVLQGLSKAHKIVHVPEILYHSHNEDTDASIQAWARQAIIHLEELGSMDADVTTSPSHAIHVTWPCQGKRVSIVIPTRDNAAVLRKCLDSLLSITRYPNYEIILMDNGSKEQETLKYYELIRSRPEIVIHRYGLPFNYSAINNEGARFATGDLLLFLNNDVEIIDPNWLEELARWAELPKIGLVGARLLYPNGTIQHAGIVLGVEGHATHIFGGMPDNASGIFGSVEWYRDYLAVTGACLMVRKAVFQELGGFDEAYQLVFNDVELGLRAVHHGYRVVYNPFARLIHHEGSTRGRLTPKNDIERGYQHFKQIISHGDPYFNQNLSHLTRQPTLHRPGEEEPVRRLENIRSWFQ